MSAQQVRCAAYVRVSTLLNQDPGNQLILIREFCRNRGFELVAEYVDFGVSGTRERRPQLDELMRDAHRGRLDMVVVTAIDRFGRSTKGLLNSIHTLSECGVSFVSLREAIDLSTPSGQLTLTVLSAVAQLESALISERIASALRAKKLAAEQSGSGWRCGRPSVASPEIINQVLELRRQGLSFRGIEKAMNREISRTSIHKIVFEHGDPHRPESPPGGQISRKPDERK